MIGDLNLKQNKLDELFISQNAELKKKKPN